MFSTVSFLQQIICVPVMNLALSCLLELERGARQALWVTATVTVHCHHLALCFGRSLFVEGNNDLVLYLEPFSCAFCACFLCL